MATPLPPRETLNEFDNSDLGAIWLQLLSLSGSETEKRSSSYYSSFTTASPDEQIYHGNIVYMKRIYVSGSAKGASKGVARFSKIRLL